MKDALMSIQRNLSSDLKETFLLNWPTSISKIVYPYGVIHANDFSHQRYNDKYEGIKNNNGDPQIVLYSIGEWRGEIEVHFFAKKNTEILDFIERWNKYFVNDPTDDNPMERTKVFEFNCAECEKFSFYYDDFTIASAKNSRRVIFNCRASIPDFVERNIHIMKPALDDRSVVDTNPDLSPVVTNG